MPRSGGECAAPLRALQQFLLDLRGGHQRLTHRLDRHELHDVQQLDLGAEGAHERLRLAPDGETVFCQVDEQQDTTVHRHDASPSCSRACWTD